MDKIRIKQILNSSVINSLFKKECLPFSIIPFLIFRQRNLTDNTLLFGGTGTFVAKEINGYGLNLRIEYTGIFKSDGLLSQILS
jgi:hypothetical protein